MRAENDTPARAPLDAAALRRAAVRPGGLWREIEVVESTGSTNADLLARALRGEPEGAVLAAEEQRAGRGRMGRTWTAPPRAALTFSLLLKPAVPPARRGWLPLLTGVAVAAAVGHDFSLSFFWDRPVHPDAGIVDRYQFADAATAWVPAGMRTPGGGTVAGDQAAYNGGRHPAPTRAVQPYASWMVHYQRYVYLPGTLLGVILLAGLAGMAVRRRVGGAGMPWAFAVTILLVPPLIVDFDLRYLVPAVPVACLAAALAFAPGPGGPGQRRWTTSPAATATSDPEERRTSSLPSESTPTAGPESA